MTEDNILYDKQDGIAVITLNRPEKLNAISADMHPRLLAICEEIKRDDAVRAAIITGAGRGFCAGADLSSGTIETGSAGGPVAAAKQMLSTESRKTDWGLTDIPKPTICALNGVAVGVGAEYALHCDVRIAAERARFGQVFVLRGLVPDTGAGTWLLPRIVGLAKACELVFSGEIIDSAEMLRIGLVSKVVPDAELMPAALEMAKRLTQGSPLALQMAKQLMYRGLDRTMEDHQLAEGAALRLAFQTEDYKEGVRSFLEKRPPEWTGR